MLKMLAICLPSANGLTAGDAKEENIAKSEANT